MKDKFLMALSGPKASHGELEAQLASHVLKNFVDLIYFSDLALNKKKTISLKLGPTSEGSFEYLFKIFDLINSAQQLNQLIDVQSCLFVAHSLGILDENGGLIQLLLSLKGETPNEIKKVANGFKFIGINFGTIIVNNPTGELYQNPDVRKALSELTSPLITNQGIDKLEFREPVSKKTYTKISSDEAAFFNYDEKEDSTEDVFIRGRIRVIKPDYEGATKWRVRFENKNIDVKIQDAEWLKSFQNTLISVPPGSWLEVEMIKRNYINNYKIVRQPTFEVQKVLSVFRPGRQQDLI